MELHFIEKKSMSWLILFGWEMRHRMDTESDEILWKGTLREKFYTQSGLTKFRLKLLSKWTLSELVQDWNLISVKSAPFN